MPQAGREERLRRYWDKHAGSYDKQMGFLDRHLFAGSRDWICAKAEGQVLEVAIGTGLNLAHYPAEVQLTGVEWSPAMLDIAKDRAGQLGRAVDLRLGDAQALEFPGACFNTVVCTFSLCAIPDDRKAVAEMARVLRPGGLLLLADHVEATSWWARAAQALIEVASVPAGGEHFRRRPIMQVRALGLTVEDHDRFKRPVALGSWPAAPAGPREPASARLDELPGCGHGGAEAGQDEQHQLGAVALSGR